MKNEIWRPLAEMKKEGLWYAIVTRDRQGKVVSRERRKSHSFLKQWNQLVYVQVTFGVLIITDTGGLGRSVDRDFNLFKMAAAAGVTTYGIRVGTGNTPVDISNFALETPITHGAGAGQMDHLICTVPRSVVAAPSCSFVVSRSIVNNSPGIITVREAAIYVMGDVFFLCVTRDVFGVPQAVPIGGAITIDWTIGVTV